MKPVNVNPPVEVEIDNAVDYLNQDGTGTGDELLAMIKEGFAFIARHPKTGGRYRRTRYRKHIVKKFKYLNWFEELDDAVRVVAVHHGHRRPGYWFKRAETIRKQGDDK